MNDKVLKIYKLLYTQFGSNPEVYSKWFKSYNSLMNCVPFDLLGDDKGCDRLISHLEKKDT